MHFPYPVHSHNQADLHGVLQCNILIAVSYTHLDVYKRQLRRELRDAQDVLDVLKKATNILGK